ncbi:Protein CBG25373 [Caenorhabditis briggsae]|uniref:Protein CBG25373 n=1 Tax=Caenorhabditis briggsae TaxID=6238 RepID=B6IIN7_CAEBR|nr:Protein CBG25373 [Caenorhabditis briggsae]CAR99767.1 Protein CBG25373 [Caenorhabditis briggsae]
MAPLRIDLVRPQSTELTKLESTSSHAHRFYDL